jgi:hypothetical protein
VLVGRSSFWGPSSNLNALFETPQIVRSRHDFKLARSEVVIAMQRLNTSTGEPLVQKVGRSGQDGMFGNFREGSKSPPRALFLTAIRARSFAGLHQ